MKLEELLGEELYKQVKEKIDAANAVEYAQDTGNMQQKLF
jgi:hypothetical protein